MPLTFLSLRPSHHRNLGGREDITLLRPLRRGHDQKEAQLARLYETVVLVDANQEDAAIEASVTKFQEMIAGNGEILRVDRWGKRKIAYEIDGKWHADYTVYYYNLNKGSFVAEFERQLRLDESVIRYLTVVDNPVGIPPLDAPEVELPPENMEKED